MVLTMEQQQVRDLLTETVTLLCKNGLKFSHELGIEGLIGITLDKEEVFLVSIKETILSDRKVFHDSSAIPDHIEEAVEFSPVLETFLGEESFKSTQQCGRVDRKNQKNCGVEIDSGTVSATNSDTHKSSSGTTRSEAVFEDIEDATKILACNYEMPRKRHRVKGNSRTVAGEQKSNFSISSDHKKQSTAAFINENNNCDESQMSSDSCAIEIKREAINENEGDENSYMAVGSLYPNSFDNFNVWNWKPSDEKPKQMLEKMSSEKHFVQYNSSISSTSTWNARSQVELVPGLQVFLDANELQLIERETKGSRLIRRLVHAIFPDHCELAASCCLGLGKQSKKLGLNQHKVDAIKEYVRQNMPHIPNKKVIRVINNLCCEARRKVLRHGNRQNALSSFSFTDCKSS